MGYIFDAMNREARDREAQKRDHHESAPPPSQADPTPGPLATPAPNAIDRADAPTPPTPMTTTQQPATPAPAVTSTSAPNRVTDEPVTPAESVTPASFDPPAQSFADVEAAEAPEPPQAPVPLRLAELMSEDRAPARPAPATITDAVETEQDNIAFVQTDLEGIDDRLVALTERVSVIAEEYRGIRTSLLARWDQRRHLIHLITSATPQEGKTITSLNLGLSLAELHNRKTIVVECDLRLPQFTNLLSLPESPGLVGYLEGGADLKQIVHSVGDSQLHVIPAGMRANDRAVQLLSSNRMAGLLDDLRRRYDHVIIDTPPVVDLADAGILGALSDDVLLIVRMHTTPRGLVEQAARTLASYNAPVTNMIATNQTHVGSSYYRSYYSRYGSRYAYRYRYNRYHEKAKAA